MRNIVLLFAALGALQPSLFGQNPVAPATDAFIKSIQSTPPDAVTPSTVVMIENRARVLADRADASGTRYFEVKNSDLAGKTASQVLQRLSPATITASEHVRTIYSVVDLQYPTLILANRGEQVYIGTASIQGAVQNLVVHAAILACDVKIVTK